MLGQYFWKQLALITANKECYPPLSVCYRFLYLCCCRSIPCHVNRGFRLFDLAFFFQQPLSFLLFSCRKTFSVYLRLFLAHASLSSLIIKIFTVPLFNFHLTPYIPHLSICVPSLALFSLTFNQIYFLLINLASLYSPD